MKLTNHDADLFRSAIQFLRAGVAKLEELGHSLNVPAADEAAEEVAVNEVVCPECEEPMKLRNGQFGRFFGCVNFPSCDYLVGAHPDGTPKGVPVDRPTRDARKRARDAFDLLWRDLKLFKSRTRAYQWLSQELGITDAHMGKMDEATCLKVVELARKKGGQHGVDEPGIINEDEVPF